VSGLSIKLHDRSTAYQGVVGVYGDIDGFGEVLGASLDVLSEIGPFVETDVIDLGCNVGIGGLMGYADSNFTGGIEGVIGLEILLDPAPIDFVIEYKPALFLTPDVDFDPVGFAGHLRVWF
jgi:hypothetical protein